MDRALSSIRIILGIFTAIAVLCILFFVPFPLPDGIGLIDFRPYWSSSLLLANGQDFSDPELMDTVERTLTGWDKPYTMSAWFSPIGNLVLLPYTFLPFARAGYYWLLTNIAILFFSALLLWHNTNKHKWIAPVSTFCFSMTLLSLIFGQVNTLVFMGLALFLFFGEKGYDFLSGASLILTTIKPHLVILTLPILLLELLRRRRLRELVGFGFVLLGCALVLFILYPRWHLSFWYLVRSGMETARETPTLGGLLVIEGYHTGAKWIWVVGLFFAIAIWWKLRKNWSKRSIIDATLLAGMIIAPVGWSYDQVILLFPILSILEWAVNGSIGTKDAVAVTLILILINAITFYERILSPSEVWYFWVPIAITGVYLYAFQRRKARLLKAQAA